MFRNFSLDSQQRISVVMTCKNGMPWVLDAIQSVFNQTYCNWDLTIIDDGSTDESPERIEEFLSGDTRARLVRTDGIGRGRALNMAVQLASGKWLANLDADDLFHPRKLEIQLAVGARIESPSIICTRSRMITDDYQLVWEEIAENLSEFDITSLMLRRNRVNHSSIMLRTDLIRRLGGYSIVRKSQFDYELWLRAIANGVRVIEIDERLTAKRVHDNQAFEARNRLRYVFASSALQLSYARRLGANFFDYVLIGCKFLFGLAPRAFRKKFWRMN